MDYNNQAYTILSNAIAKLESLQIVSSKSNMSNLLDAIQCIEAVQNALGVTDNNTNESEEMLNG